jgi:hypothetical protein
VAGGVSDQAGFAAVNAPGLEALSESEVDLLAGRLASIKNDDALSLEGVDGLFCALIASPVSVLPSEYLPVILGGEAGNSQTFEDIEDANVTMSLLTRYWNSIIADLERDSIHLPFIVEPLGCYDAPRSLDSRMLVQHGSRSKRMVS